MPRHRADASPLGPGGPLSRLFLLVVVVMHVHAVLVVAVLVDPLWGAPKIHGELLKLGIDVAQSTVSIYMVPRQGRPLRAWKIFLRNHVEEIAWIDLFVVPTIAFRQLFAFLVLGHRRRQLLWFAATQNPTRSGWRAKSPKHSLGTRCPNISSVTMTEHLAARSRLGYEQWASRTGPPRSARPGMPSIITRCERLLRPAHARSSGSETLLRIRSLAGYVIGTLESRFRKRQGVGSAGEILSSMANQTRREHVGAAMSSVTIPGAPNGLDVRPRLIEPKEQLSPTHGDFI
jgi:hypothetical protein